MTHPISKPLRLAAAALLVAALAAPPAFAVNKDMIQLQTQVQQLQDAVARLQQSADSVNRMSLNMDALQKQMRTQGDATGGKLDQVSTQVQALNDSLDEMKARIARLDKAMQDLQNQQQTISATLQNGSPAGAPASAPATSVPDTMAPAPTSNLPTAPTRRGKPSAGVPLSAAPDNAPPPVASAPPIEELYKTALGDYMAAKFALASAEFADVVRAYPDNPLSGNSFYYMGEIDYRNGHYAAAEKDYDHVLEQYPGNAKIPAAHLHKGQALLVQKDNEAGIRELRSLIARFPNSPEASQARSKLSGLGVPVTPRR